jgi:hypothetical protein
MIRSTDIFIWLFEHIVNFFRVDNLINETDYSK